MPRETETSPAGQPWYPGLSPAAQHVLGTGGTVRRYRTGQVLFKAGERAQGLHLVLEGKVRVVRTTRARGQVVHVEGAGGTLGEIPLFTGAPYPATATAAEPTRCLVVSREVVRAAILADPGFAFQLLAGLSARVRGLIERLDRLVSTSVRARLAAWIAERAARTLGPVVSLGLTQAQLAEELGTVREVVVKELAALRRAGVVRARGAGRVEVVDAAALARLASGSAPSVHHAPARGDAPRGGRRP